MYDEHGSASTVTEINFMLPEKVINGFAASTA